MTCILAFLLALSAAATRQDAPQSAPTQAQADGIQIRVASARAPAAMAIESPLLPGERIELRTCEVLLDGNRDFGVFTIAPREEDWKREENTLSYAFRLPEGLEIAFSAQAQGDSVLLRYRLTNGTDGPLQRPMAGPCVPTLGVPSFYPGSAEEARADVGGRAARVRRSDYSELYGRLFLFARGKRFSFSEAGADPAERHLAFLRRGEEPIEWSWWVNAKERFDLPLIAAASKDGKLVLALGFERADWASSNVGDGRACFHLFPLLGRIPRGESRTVEGRLYVLEGSPEDARARFVRDFPEAD